MKETLVSEPDADTFEYIEQPRRLTDSTCSQFPYAIQALPEVVQQKWNDPEFTKYRDEFPEEHRGSPEALEAHVQDLTRRDIKIAYLKNLQGRTFVHGFILRLLLTDREFNL